MEETISGNDIITDTPIEENPSEVIPNENIEPTPDTIPEILPENNDTVSGSDVRTDTDTTTEYIDYTDLLTSIDAHLEVIESTYAEQTMDIMSKPFEKYTVLESIGLVISVVAVCVILYQLLFGK